MGAAPSQPGPGTTDAAPAGLAPRIVARVIDAVILGIVGGALGLALDFGTLWLLVQAAGVFAYFVLLDVAWGTTLGKRLFRLEVVGPHGGPPTVAQAAVREAFTLLGAIPYAGPLLAVVAWTVIAVTISTSSTSQGKHDQLAGGTLVRRVTP